MKSLLTVSLTLLFVFGFFSQSRGQTMTNDLKLKIEKQVDSVFHAMIKAGETMDYDKLSEGVDDTKNAGFIVNGVYYPEYKVLANTLKSNLPFGAKQTINIQKEKVTVLTERIVLITAAGKANVELSSNQSFSSDFLWSFVYEKIGDQWKVIQSHQSQVN